MCRLTILFPGRFCVSVAEQVMDPAIQGKLGLGHTRLDAAGLLAWLNASQPIPCKEQFDGAFDSAAVVAPENAKTIARLTLNQLGLGPQPTEEEVRKAIEKKGVAVL